MLLSKKRRLFNCFLIIGGLKNKTLIPTVISILAKKWAYVLFHLFLPTFPSLSKPSVQWDWLGSAHPYGSISNSSCTGYQILCLLVPGSKSSADLWTSVQKKKKKKKPGVWRRDAPLWIKSSNQPLSPVRRPGLQCLDSILVWRKGCSNHSCYREGRGKA